MDNQVCKQNAPKVKLRNCTQELLQELNKNVCSAKQCLLTIVQKVKDSSLSQELTTQLNEYGVFTERIKTALDSCGSEQKDCSMVEKLSSRISVEMSTIADSTDAHLAQLIIEEITMYITDTIRLVRDYENSSCSEGALTLARSVVSFQEKSIESMKKHL